MFSGSCLINENEEIGVLRLENTTGMGQHHIIGIVSDSQLKYCFL